MDDKPIVFTDEMREEIKRMALLDIYGVIRFSPTPLHELSAGDLAHLVFEAIRRGRIRGIGIKEQGE